MEKTPKSFRLHIGFFGRQNVGKSSLLNAITRQYASIVSDTAGTTTDPVEKPMEFLPLGPVLFIDTAGIDDAGALGQLRIEKTKQIFDRTDLGVVVTEANQWGHFESVIFNELERRHIPIVVVLNKIDLLTPDDAIVQSLASKKNIRIVKTSAQQRIGLLEFRKAILETAPEAFFDQSIILRDLVAPKSVIIQVIPIDREAPRGRLLLPQVQTIRDALDGHAVTVVVKETEYLNALQALKHPPQLVVTDSSRFKKIAQETPLSIPLTSFSILFARLKGDLLSQVIDTCTLDRLKPGDAILISEACSHHPIEDDIGRVKIPHWINDYVGGELNIHIRQGHDFPKNLTSYRLVILCGSCMFNRKEVISRILACREAGVPCTNYGLVIAYCLGIFNRVLEPFPEALKAYQQHLLGTTN